MPRILPALILLPVLGLSIGACTVPSSEDVDDARQAERWNDENDPVAVDPSFKVEIGSLPLAGQSARLQIPADYWATFKDAINYRWDGPDSLSPAEKYERAFERPGVAMAVSMTDGIRGQLGRRECTTNEECRDLADGSNCGIPRGETKGRCIPTWWGLCHGWAPFAIAEDAPVKPVTRNGVTFYPGDLEALGTIIYAHNLPALMLSERCDVANPEIDPNGRFVASDCRDMNPGSFHVLIANMLGIRKKGFVYDKTAADQVWNQPVYSYRVTNAQDGKLTSISKSDAIRLVSGSGDTYTYNPDAVSFYYVKADVQYLVEATPARTSRVSELGRFLETDRLEYVLEADANGVILGGEWVGISRQRHPDFAWWPTGEPFGTVANGTIKYEEVKALLKEAAGR